MNLVLGKMAIFYIQYSDFFHFSLFLLNHTILELENLLSNSITCSFHFFPTFFAYFVSLFSPLFSSHVIMVISLHSALIYKILLHIISFHLSLSTNLEDSKTQAYLSILHMAVRPSMFKSVTQGLITRN